MDITHDNVCSSMLSCFYSHLLSTGRPISSFSEIFVMWIHPGQNEEVITFWERSGSYSGYKENPEIFRNTEVVAL